MNFKFRIFDKNVTHFHYVNINWGKNSKINTEVRFEEIETMGNGLHCNLPHPIHLYIFHTANCLIHALMFGKANYSLVSCL